MAFNGKLISVLCGVLALAGLLAWAGYAVVRAHPSKAWLEERLNDGEAWGSRAYEIKGLGGGFCGSFFGNSCWHYVARHDGEGRSDLQGGVVLDGDGGLYVKHRSGWSLQRHGPRHLGELLGPWDVRRSSDGVYSGNAGDGRPFNLTLDWRGRFDELRVGSQLLKFHYKDVESVALPADPWDSPLALDGPPADLRAGDWHFVRISRLRGTIPPSALVLAFASNSQPNVTVPWQRAYNGDFWFVWRDHDQDGLVSRGDEYGLRIGRDGDRVQVLDKELGAPVSNPIAWSAQQSPWPVLGPVVALAFAATAQRRLGSPTRH